MYNRLGAEEVQQLLNVKDLWAKSSAKCNQQLLGDKATSIHRSFLWEIFLQCLPANICIVLVSTSNTSTLEEVAQLANKIIVAAVYTSADVEQLHTEVSRLTNIVESLTKRKISRDRSPRPHPQSSSTLCWYHKCFGNDAYIKCWSHVPNRQTTQPVASGDEHWPITKLPVLCDWQTLWPPFPCWYQCWSECDTSFRYWTQTLPGALMPASSQWYTDSNLWIMIAHTRTRVATNVPMGIHDCQHSIPNLGRWFSPQLLPAGRHAQAPSILHTHTTECLRYRVSRLVSQPNIPWYNSSEWVQCYPCWFPSCHIRL